MPVLNLPTHHHDEQVHCIYLDKKGYLKWYMEYYTGRIEVTKEKAEKAWRRCYKHTINGKEYRQFVDRKGFSADGECDIARKYGFERVERMEWFD